DLRPAREHRVIDAERLRVEQRVAARPASGERTLSHARQRRIPAAQLRDRRLRQPRDGGGGLVVPGGDGERDDDAEECGRGESELALEKPTPHSEARRSRNDLRRKPSTSSDMSRTRPAASRRWRMKVYSSRSGTPAGTVFARLLVVAPSAVRAGLGVGTSCELSVGSRRTNHSDVTTAPNAAVIATAIAHASRWTAAAITATPMRKPACRRNRGRLRESTGLFCGVVGR